MVYETAVILKNTPRQSPKTLSIIFTSLIIILGAISLFLPEEFINTYLAGYVLAMTLIAFILVFRVFRFLKDQDFIYVMLGFIVAFILFWTGVLSWNISLKFGFQEVLMFSNILIISAYAAFIYICLRSLRDHLHRISTMTLLQIYAGNVVLYILFSTPLLYSVLSSQRPFLDVVFSFAHPVMDIILFTFVLLLLTLYFKKMVGYHWFWICMSFLLIIGGDMVYTYYSVLGIQSLYLLTNAFYGVAYGILVIGLLLISAKSELVPPIFANSDK